MAGKSFTLAKVDDFELSCDLTIDDDDGIVNLIQIGIESRFTGLHQPSVNIEIPITNEEFDQIISRMQEIKQQALIGEL